MTQLNWKLLRLIPVLGVVLALGFAACTKKRDTQFAYGEGADLLPVSEYDNKTFEVQTKEKNASLPLSSNQKQDEKSNGEFVYVDYQTDSKLLPAIENFIGLPQTKYSYVVKLLNTKMVLYKLGDKRNLSPDELVSAEDIEFAGKTVKAVPEVEYPIMGYFKVEAARNDNNEKTSKLKEYPVSSKEQATHFRYDKSSYTILNVSIKKQIMDPKYFEGTWYTNSVISKVSEEEASELGSQVSVDSKWESAELVTFVPSETRIIGLNASYDERIKIENDVDKVTNLGEVISIPVKWVDYGRRGAKAESKEEVKETRKSWKEKKYVEVDFQNISNPIVKSLKDLGEPTLSDLVVKENFFMFSLQFQGKKVTIAFLKDNKAQLAAEKKYVPKRYFTDDFRYFGFFATQKKSLGTYEKYRKEDYEKYTSINRFNLNKDQANGKRYVRFHLTENSVTDPELIEAVQNTMKEWTRAFHEAGMNDVEITLEDKRVTLGDLRYNAINLVRTLTSSSLFGYGPSLADPTTGEIISATTNLHVTSIKTQMVSLFRNYIRHARHQLDANYPLGRKSGGIVAPTIPVVANLTQATATSTLTSTGTAEKKVSAPQLTHRFDYDHNQCDFDATAGNMIRDIETNPDCQSLVALAKSSSNQGEIEAFESCAKALLPQKVQATLIHEVGHNLGLRHNFAASTDVENFPRQQNSGDVIARSSSVMEYTDFNEDRLTIAGPYDIEALRFGYGNAVRAKDNRVIPLNPAKSIAENLSDKAVAKKSYRFCTDEHVALGMDPLCQRFDSGTTPLEVVESLINQFNTLYATENFRYDRAQSPSPQALQIYKKRAIFDRLKLIYDQWRLYVTEYVGEENRSLDTYDVKAYSEILGRMGADPKYGPLKNFYQPAAERIFNFLMQVTFMPTRYCLIKKDTVYQLVDIEKLSGQVSAQNGVVETSCKDPHIAVLLKSGPYQGFELDQEVGFFSKDKKRNTDMFLNAKEFFDSKGTSPEQLNSYYDVIGSVWDRDLAKDTLSKRDTSNFFAAMKGFGPSFLDEPKNRDQFINRILDRILKGVAWTDLVPSSGREGADNVYFPKFADDKDLLIQTWSYLRLGISVLGKDVMNEQRSIRWRVSTSSEPGIIASAVAKYQLPSGSYVLAMSPENDIAIQLIKKYGELQEMRKKQPEVYSSNQIEYDAQISLIGFILNI